LGDGSEDREDYLHGVLHEARKQQVEETKKVLFEEPEGFYRSYLD
jgi:hypothetical protein